jgi:hypothetical protein
MARLLTPLIALALFIGLGFVTRPLFKGWFEGKMKEAEAYSAKEKAKWKPVETRFKGVTFDKPITTGFDFNRPAPRPGRK